MLRQFDYLSTVSGGGFIGGWLQVLIREQGGVGNAEETLNQPRPARLRRLRAYTNYLTPQTGPLSTDTWAGIGALPAQPADQLGGVRAAVHAAHGDPDLLSDRDLGVQRLPVDQPGAVGRRRAGAVVRRGARLQPAAQPSAAAILGRPDTRSYASVGQYSAGTSSIRHSAGRCWFPACWTSPTGRWMTACATGPGSRIDTLWIVPVIYLGVDDPGLSPGMVAAVAPRRSRHFCCSGPTSAAGSGRASAPRC